MSKRKHKNLSAKTLFVSFSGGKTSAYMARWIQINWHDRYEKIHYLFANTGQEHEKTLEFVRECDTRWGLGVVWLEAVINQKKGVGIRFNVVDFSSADRDGRHFEQYIKKEGLPNPANRKCSDRLKLTPMLKYIRSLGHKNGTYDTAVGIRADEIDRVNKNWEKLRLVYPLVTNNPTNVEQVNNFWVQQDFALEIPSHHGNCVWCWAKSDRKLLTNIVDHPEWFEFPRRMERKYSQISGVNTAFTVKGRSIFRGNRTTLDLIELSKVPFDKFIDRQCGVYTLDMFDKHELDRPASCAESCDAYQ